LPVPFLGGKDGEIIVAEGTIKFYCDPADRSVLLVRMSDKTPDHYLVLSLENDFSEPIRFSEEKGYYSDRLEQHIELSTSITIFQGEWSNHSNVDSE
jgi:hypothetical protein